jgi:hypothetical protein
MADRKDGSIDHRSRAWKEAMGDHAALRNAARNSRIVTDYLTGNFTMCEIGVREGISRERVRQVLSDQAPMEFKNVRKIRREAMRAEIKLRKNVLREAAFLQLWGCDRERMAYILAVFPDAQLRFKENKGNAHTMNRPWKMTFCEWAMCWINSGKVWLRGHKSIHKSGRYSQYWMSPIDPAIGYVIGNVRIVRVVVALKARDKRKLYKGQIATVN